MHLLELSIGAYKQFYKDNLAKLDISQYAGILRKAMFDRVDADTPSWLSMYKALWKKPLETIQDQKLTFDDLIRWLKVLLTSAQAHH